MNTSRDWEKTIRRLELLLRLKSFPVALRLFEDEDALSGIPYLRRPEHKVTLCQLVSQARSFDWTVGATGRDFIGQMCPSIIGLAGVSKYMADGTFRSIVWTRSRAEGASYEAQVPRVPEGRFKAVALAPLVYNPFDPDMVLIYANPAQMILLVNALQFTDYQVMEFACVGETSCADALARCWLTGRPQLAIPCYGERRYGHAADDELVMALPPAFVDKALAGLEALYKRGVRYPISPAGAEVDVSKGFPGAYGQDELLDGLRGHPTRLLVGVTGSIATGKTTVADMLAARGARVIDFDLLSRQAVEPGRPAWQDIVDFFGRQVLASDETLDRKKMSEIVFGDLEKKKKLESFIHPRLTGMFLALVEKYTAQDPGAVILTVIPLLIETGMQALFDHLLMVYVNEEEQLKRLMARDGLDEPTAKRIMGTQMNVEEKKGYCDLVIDNSGGLEQTRERAGALWERLLELRENKAERMAK